MLGFETLRAAPGACAVLNAANEVAVQAFLEGRIRFDQIHAVNAATLEGFSPHAPKALSDLLQIDHESRCRAEAQMLKLAV